MGLVFYLFLVFVFVFFSECLKKISQSLRGGQCTNARRASSHPPCRNSTGLARCHPPSGGPRPVHTCCRPHAEQKPPSQLPPPALRDVTVSSKSAQQWPTALLAKQAQQLIPYLPPTGDVGTGNTVSLRKVHPHRPSHTGTPPAPCPRHSLLIQAGLCCREGTSSTRHPDSHA